MVYANQLQWSGGSESRIKVREKENKIYLGYLLPRNSPLFSVKTMAIERNGNRVMRTTKKPGLPFNYCQVGNKTFPFDFSKKSQIYHFM